MKFSQKETCEILPNAPLTDPLKKDFTQSKTRDTKDLIDPLQRILHNQKQL